MKVLADLHIHGPYSRATSRSTTVWNLEKYARLKGLNLLGTGDFTHPQWLSMLKSDLSEDRSGILKSKTGFSFMLTTEVSNIYSQEGSLRKVHNVIHAPDFDTVDQINELLSKRGKLEADGRPIFGSMSCAELVESLIEINPKIAIIPAHAWTPWFGIFGSKSGFDTVEECFGDQSRHIFAIETGMSSDPEMNWRLSKLDKYALVSNSDAHSYWPWRIGREANVFELGSITYDGIMDAIREKDPKRFLYTIEVDPSYGKYHFDGHRDCNVRLSPGESLKIGSMCPVCRRPLTVGVLNRVEELADREEGYKPRGSVPFMRLLPLTEILSSVKGIDQLYSKKLWEEYNKLIERFGTEFSVLIEAKRSDIAAVSGDKAADAVIGIREGRISVEPGYDGVYGKLMLEDAKKEETSQKGPQRTLSSFIG